MATSFTASTAHRKKVSSESGLVTLYNCFQKYVRVLHWNILIVMGSFGEVGVCNGALSVVFMIIFFLIYCGFVHRGLYC